MNARVAYFSAAIVLTLPAAIAAFQSTRVNPDAAVIADFTKRVKAYADLRDKVDDGAATLKERKDPAKIVSAQDILATRIQTARADAKPGDIFTPEIRKKFLALLRPELKGKEGAETRATIKDEEVGPVPLKVNAKYPEKEPLSTVPPKVLASLPKLPDGLEYRFVHNDLILLDARANLIVDFIRNAIA